MTDEQKYNELLKEIGSVINEKNRQLFMLGFEIDTLRRKLEEAEKQIANAEKAGA